MSGRRGRGRPTKEYELTDKAIRHFQQMGYPESDIRSTVEQLIQVFGREGLKFIKEDHYRVVQDALFEKQEQEEQPQRLLVQEEPNKERGKQLQRQQQEETKQKEGAMSEAPVERDMTMVEVHNEISAVEVADPMLVDHPAPEATLPRPAATGTSRARRPCYGWISESESDSDYEEYLASRQQQLSIDGM